jgi:hypothetical protein
MAWLAASDILTDLPFVLFRAFWGGFSFVDFRETDALDFMNAYMK